VYLAIPPKLSRSLPSALPIPSLPLCANHACPRPPTLWQRWWARKEGIRLENDWFCSPECLTAGLRKNIENELRPSIRHPAPASRLPLGLILLEQGLISHAELQDALRLQRQSGKRRIGEWLVRMGSVRPRDVIDALAVQQNCPVFRSPAAPAFPDLLRFPLPLIRVYGGVPVYFDRTATCLYVGFCGPLHRQLLRAAERLLRCRIEPCIVSEGFHRRATEHWQTSSCGEAIAFEQRQALREMSRTMCDYAEQTGAASCAMARCQDHLWTRLSGDLGSLDLLFRCHTDMDVAATTELESAWALV